MSTMIRMADLDVLPLTLTIPSQSRTSDGPYGQAPVTYRFRKGVPVKVEDAADVDMLLGLTKRCTGYGGKGIAEVRVFEVVSPQAQVQTMTDGQKLAALLELLQNRGLDIEKIIADQQQADLNEVDVAEDSLADDL